MATNGQARRLRWSASQAREDVCPSLSPVVALERIPAPGGERAPWSCRTRP